ncbi:MAG: hypothetical protein R3C49_26840 [Planctomycetaceae bacterium]
MIEFSCPSCGKKYRVQDSFAGKTARCKECESPMPIPAAADSPAASAPPAPAPRSAQPASPAAAPQAARRKSATAAGPDIFTAEKAAGCRPRKC